MDRETDLLSQLKDLEDRVGILEARDNNFEVIPPLLRDSTELGHTLSYSGVIPTPSGFASRSVVVTGISVNPLIQNLVITGFDAPLVPTAVAYDTDSYWDPNRPVPILTPYPSGAFLLIPNTGYYLLKSNVIFTDTIALGSGGPYGSPPAQFDIPITVEVHFSGIRKDIFSNWQFIFNYKTDFWFDPSQFYQSNPGIFLHFNFTIDATTIASLNSSDIVYAWVITSGPANLAMFAYPIDLEVFQIG